MGFQRFFGGYLVELPLQKLPGCILRGEVGLQAVDVPGGQVVDVPRRQYVTI